MLAAGAAALVSFGSSRALGAAPAVTRGNGPAPAAPGDVRVWYRSSETCPDGAAFVGLLGRLQRSVSLAGVGDHVDFVVTLASSPQQSSGRLERQSSEGTVAIREVNAASCQEVAEVLALSLDLALQPAPEPVRAELDTAHGAAEPEAAPAEAGWEPRVGAQGTILTGLAHTVLPGAALFFDLRPPASEYSTRLSVRGALGERDAAVGVTIALLTARLEGCWSASLGSVRAGPCLGADLGLVSAEGSGDTGQDDAGVWSSGSVSARGSWQLGRSVALEAQAGLSIPFVRYRFSAVEGGDVASSASLGFDAALGFSIRL